MAEQRAPVGWMGIADWGWARIQRRLHKHEVRMYRLDFGICNADRILGLCATVRAGRATSLTLDAFALLDSFTSCPTAIHGFLQRCTASARYEPPSRDETTKGLLALCTTTFGTPAPPKAPIHPKVNSSTPDAAPRSHAESIRRLPKSHDAERAHQLTCCTPFALALCLGIFLCLKIPTTIASLHFAKCPLASRNLHPSKFPYPTFRSYFPIPFQDARCSALHVQ
jgi:hypothetical protein